MKIIIISRIISYFERENDSLYCICVYIYMDMDDTVMCLFNIYEPIGILEFIHPHDCINKILIGRNFI